MVNYITLTPAPSLLPYSTKLPPITTNNSTVNSSLTHNTQYWPNDQSNTELVEPAMVRDLSNLSLVITYEVSAGDFYTSETSKMNTEQLGATNASVLMSDWSSSTSSSHLESPASSNEAVVTTSYIIIFSTLFFVVGTVGIAGNVMVVSIVLSDSKMRRSMTNMLILNLALADSLIMLFGLPEIVLFLLNDGWQLGQVACSIDRTILVCALYSSVLTLVAVCIERYIAIVFPIKAHIMCTKRRVFAVMVLIWIVSGLCATPTAVFNTVLQLSETPPQNFCVTAFHVDKRQHDVYNMIFKYTESVVFYLGPLSIQVICYAIIGKRLFVGVEKLHRNSGGISSASRPNGRGPTRAYSEAIRARRGVVKMLMASVAIYFLSYSPHQIMLYYSSFSTVSFDKTWMFHVLTYTLAYINSAANPVLYCIFSDNFRSKFKVIFRRCVCCNCCCCKSRDLQRPIVLHSYTEYTSLVKKNTTNRQNSIPAVAL